MEDCKDAPYSEEYYDLLVSYLSLENEYLPGGCIQNIDKDFNVVYLQSAGLPKLDIDQYTYSAIPKCFTTLDEEALQAGGIIRVQSQPNLALRGQGVLIGFVDTGIDYQNEVFRNSDGSSRILRIWDQSIRSEDTPEGFLYGTEYTKEQIDMALLTDAPLRVVPHRDEEGHGTFMAGLAAGSEKLSEKFAGVAPYAQIAMVKLKPAKKYLRRFYYIPEGAKAYQENDIMAGVAYLTRLAERYRRPLVIYLGLGSNSGDHSGNSVISYYLNYVSLKRNTAVVVAAGNEATARHHYYGEVAFGQQSDVVEVNVEDPVEGFHIEMWAKAPELYSVQIISPTGERTAGVRVQQDGREVYRFVFENTQVTIDYRIVGTATGDQLIYIRFDQPTRGIWTIEVNGNYSIEGRYHMWLPITGLIAGDISFIRSNPDTTITMPGNAAAPMTAGGYNAGNGSIYLNSSRGYTASGQVKPDFAAPGVNVIGPVPGNRFEARSGTSIAAAITAGAAALYLEWAVERGYNTDITNAEIKNDFIRGAVRLESRVYPNREWGYGTLNLYQTFEQLRRT